MPRVCSLDVFGRHLLMLIKGIWLQAPHSHYPLSFLQSPNVSDRHKLSTDWSSSSHTCCRALAFPTLREESSIWHSETSTDDQTAAPLHTPACLSPQETRRLLPSQHSSVLETMASGPSIPGLPPGEEIAAGIPPPLCYRPLTQHWPYLWIIYIIYPLSLHIRFLGGPCLKWRTIIPIFLKI